jgi:hypothetical protein
MGRNLEIYRNPQSFMRLKEADPFYEKSKKHYHINIWCFQANPNAIHT